MRSPLSGLAPARRRLTVIVLAGLVVALVAVVGMLVVHRLAGGGIAEQSRPGPVLVIPGYGGNTAALGPIVTELRDSGRDVTVFEPTDGGTGDLEVQARRLAALAKRTMDRTGTESVDLIGYSAGGVVSRLYVQHDGGASVVRRVVTLASPHHGADVAGAAQQVAGGCPKACEQLVPGSDLLRRLDAGDETPTGPRWVTVRTTADQIVTPIDSAMLAGALNIAVQDLCPEATTTHGGIPGDPVVLATLRSSLGTDAPRPPKKVTC